jgi:hypothetical protein
MSFGKSGKKLVHASFRIPYFFGIIDLASSYGIGNIAIVEFIVPVTFPGYVCHIGFGLECDWQLESAPDSCALATANVAARTVVVFDSRSFMMDIYVISRLRVISKSCPFKFLNAGRD